MQWLALLFKTRGQLSPKACLAGQSAPWITRRTSAIGQHQRFLALSNGKRIMRNRPARHLSVLPGDNCQISASLS
jgi:hypothetical protein